MKRGIPLTIVLALATLLLSLRSSSRPLSAAAQESVTDLVYLPLVSQSPPNSGLSVERILPAGFDDVFDAILAVLKDSEESVSLADRERGLINTGSVPASNQQLRDIVAEDLLEFLGEQDGRYLISFLVERVDDENTSVTVTALIIVNTGETANLLGGQPAASSGDLENTHLDAIAEKLSGPPIPQSEALVQSCCPSAPDLPSSPANLQVNQPDHNATNLDNNTTQSETSIAVFGPTVVVGWNDSSQVASTGLMGLTSMTGYGFSTDGGATFNDAGLLAPAPGFVNIGDPALAVDSSGNFYFASLAVNNVFTSGGSRIAVARSTSTSPAVTFGTPTLLQGLLGTSSAFQDKELIAVDTSGGPFDGRVYVAWTEFANSSDSTPRLLFARSTSTAPLAFAPPIPLTPADALNHGGMPAVGPSGEVYVVWGRFIFTGGAVTSESIRILKSTDGGVNFVNPDPADAAPNKTIASPTPAPDLLTTGGINIRTRGFPYIGVDTTPLGSPTRGNVYVVYQADPDGAGPDLSDIFFTRSLDGGATWSAPAIINKAPAVTDNPDTTTNDNWQPSIAVSPSNGEIAVTFYDRRNDTTAADGDPANTKVSLFKAISRDGGLTWSNEQASDVAFTPATGYDPLLVATYMGDYIYTVADASSYHLTWGDTRNTCAPPGGAIGPCSPSGRPDQDVFYEKEAIESDLSITKTDAPDPVIAGDTLTYSLEVTNNGPSSAGGVTLTDVLPAGVTFDSSNPGSPTCSQAGGVVTCALGILALGDTSAVTIDVLVDADLVFNNGGPLTITNNASVASLTQDPDPSNNTASEDTLVVAAADLEIISFDAIDPPAEVLVGEDVGITLRKIITNNGPSAPMDAQLTKTATAPAGSTVTPDMVSEDQLALDLAEMRPVTEEFTISCGAPGDNTFTFTNEIQPLHAADTDPDPSNNTAQVDVQVACVLPVAINIKPGSFPNSINPDSRDVIPVAVLSTLAGEYGLPSDFDATRIDPLSVRFGPHDAVWNETGGAFEAHHRGHLEDSHELDEVTRDGDLDMVLHFHTRETGIGPGDTRACAKGEWVDSGGTVQKFFGCDSVRIVPSALP